MKDEFDSLLTEALALERTKDLDDFEKLEFDASLPAEPPVPRGFTKRLSFAIVIAAAFALISTAACAGWYELHIQAQNDEVKLWMSNGETEETFGNLQFRYLPSNFSVVVCNEKNVDFMIPDFAVLYKISTDKHTAKLAYLKSDTNILLATSSTTNSENKALMDSFTLYTSVSDLTLDTLSYDSYPCWPASDGNGYFILVSNTFGSSSESTEMLKVLKNISGGEETEKGGSD